MVCMQQRILRNQTEKVPQGWWRRLAWLGPGLLWMLSAVGTGSILFTPRVAAAYQYQLLWLLLFVVALMWIMIREMARYSIVTGRSMLDGMNDLPGPRGWAVWVIFIPQLLAAAVGIAGLAAVVGSAVSAFLPAPASTWGIAIVVICAAVTASGKYGLVEAISRIMAIALMVMAIVTAIMVWDGGLEVFVGLRPSWPQDADWYVIIPWVGTILAGSMGIIWFGYWTAARGFGGGIMGDDETVTSRQDDHESLGQAAEQDESSRKQAVRSWIRLMNGTAALGVIGGLLVLLAFMILGAELLAPQGIMPAGPEVAVELTKLFSEVWGEFGRYLMLIAIMIALGGSILANQDGWGRSFADINLILAQAPAGKKQGPLSRQLARLNAWFGKNGQPRRNLKRLYILGITGVVPVAILLVATDPVRVMSLSGIIAAAHTPFIVLIALWVNRRQLPIDLRPGLLATTAMAVAGLFYLLFAIAYFGDLLGLSILS